ncbi:hypothetical protein [Polaromonas vacuolata]|nr:hypothetical protein [Polaromonas vacuolata]
MSGLPAIGNAAALGWLLHTVRPLLRSSNRFGPAIETCAGSDAVRLSFAPRKPYTGGCFAGPEGAGCALSGAEQDLLDNIKTQSMSWEQ